MTNQTTNEPDVEAFFDEITAINDYAKVIYKFSERPDEVSNEEAEIICRMAGLICDNIKPMMAALEPK